VHKTSLALENNAHLYGPPHGQLLVVAEEYDCTAGEEFDVSIAIDSLARQLLRDDSWLMSLTQESWVELEADLKAVLKNAPIISSSEGQSKHDSSGPPSVPQISLTAAFVTWPRATIVQIGNSTAYLCRDNGAVPLTALRDPGQLDVNADESELRESEILPFHRFPSESQAASIGNSPINGWHGELSTDDVLVLCTSSVPQHVTATEIAKAACNAGNSAEICASQIEQSAVAASKGDTASVVVAKLQSGAAGQRSIRANTDKQIDQAQEEGTASIAVV